LFASVPSFQNNKPDSGAFLTEF